jgi:hypothetical protein
VTLIEGPSDDAVFISFMKEADYLWACYTPDYNQSSGVFGRALQLDKPTITRCGSQLARMQKLYGTGITVTYGDVEQLFASLDKKGCQPDRRPTASGKNIFLIARKRLRAACGMPEEGQSTNAPS